MPAALLLAAGLTVAPGIHVIPGTFTPGSQPDGNTVILEAPEGLIVVDTGRHAEHTQQILDFARASKQPVKAIINTHWHLDHISGNALLRREFPETRVHASDAIREARQGFLVRYRKQLEEMIAAAADESAKSSFRAELARIDAGDQLMPDHVIERTGRYVIAGRPLLVGLAEHAATAGDVWILDRAAGVLIAGDLITLPAPFLDTACPAGWSDALELLSALELEIVIPGHGAPMNGTQLEIYRGAFASLRECAAGGIGKDGCVRGWVETAGKLVPESEHEFTRVLMGYYLDVLRGDPQNVAALCGD